MNPINYCAGSTIIALNSPQTRHLIQILVSTMVATTVIDVVHYH